MADVVVDASALVDLLLGGALGLAVAARLRNERLHVPSHADGEVLSALGRLHRASALTATEVDELLRAYAVSPIVRHELPDLLIGAWTRRDRVRLVDAVYLELAARLGAPLVTTDLRLQNEPGVEAIGL